MQKPTTAQSKRTATVERRTKETAITATVDLDGSGTYAVETGVGFLDHMIEQLARHSGLGGAEEFDRYAQERERDIRQRTEGGFDPARAVGSAVSPSEPLAGRCSGAVGSPPDRRRGHRCNGQCDTAG